MIQWVSTKAICQSKVAYHGRRKAEKAVAKQAAAGRVRHFYECRHCGHYHLTKMDQR